MQIYATVVKTAQQGYQKLKVGDLVKLYDSTRRNGILAGKLDLVIDIDNYNNPVVSVGGTVKALHLTQIGEIINESR